MPAFVHTAVDVFRRLRQVEGLQRAAQYDALLQLAQIGSIQLTVQFGLTGQDHLNQLAAAVFEIAQQADLFKHFPFQVVRFVDDQNRGAALLRLLQQATD